jgi:hypothetical protein
MTRYLGGLITADETKTIPANNFQDTSASGIWTLSEAEMLNKQSLWPTAGNVNTAKFIENIFSIDLYLGGVTTPLTITNNIDLSGEGGLVWIKGRTSAFWHQLADTERGANKMLSTNSTNGESSRTQHLTAFTSTGFTVGNDNDVNYDVVGGSQDDGYVAYTFRKAPKFFDVVQYSGTGSEQSIAHNLGQVPGMIIHKRTDTNEDWRVYHRSLDSSSPEDYIISLNSASARTADNTNFGAPTSTHFVVKTSSGTNNSSGTYIAYLFGHDTSSDGMIQCGTFTTDSSGNYDGSTALGFEPQWFMWKSYSTTDNWPMIDSMRGYNRGIWNVMYADAANAESPANSDRSNPTPQGFIFRNGQNIANQNYLYMAIRRGPMATPTSRASVLDIQRAASPFTAGFPTDLAIQKNVTSTGGWYTITRVAGGAAKSLELQSDAVEGSIADQGLDNMSQWGGTNWGSQSIAYSFRRSPSFLDVVAYTGTGSARTVNHNLTVAPEMIWCKSRETVSSSNSWWVYHKNLPTPNDDAFTVNSLGDIATGNGTLLWNSTAPTSTVFSLGTYNGLNQSGKDYVAYLWATLAGISKVGSFSHTNGSSTDVDCGFSSGSSLVWVRRIDSGISNDALFYVWDSARGIVSGNDSYMALNSDAAEVTNTDLIDPLNSGFQIASGFTTGDYIFYAIAS